ncbi:MAG: exonuclease domain-containing protein [Planctomycetota bacterium]|nr:exonuclease domain-containing protein [Planctomycetota bacterium]
MDFVALDFETANNNASSACQLGVVVVRDSEIVEEYCWLIRPQRLYFAPRNIAVHGIRPRQVADAPSMASLWKNELAELVDEKVLIAHNARFDMGVLVASLAAYDLSCPNLDFSCTRLLAQAAWPGKSRYGLKPLADWLQIQFKHHDALEDARACAEVALAAARSAKCLDLPAMEKQLQLRRGKIHQGQITSPVNLRRRKGTTHGGRQSTDKWGFPSNAAAKIGSVDSSAIVQASAGNAPLAGKNIVMLGPLRGLDVADTNQLIEQLGGCLQTDIQPSTHYVVACGTTLEAAGQIVCQAVAEQPESYESNSPVQGVRLLSERQFRALLPGGKADSW